MLTVKQLAEKLNVAPSTIYTWVDEQKITYVRLPKGIRFPVSVVESFLKDRTIKAKHMAVIAAVVLFSSCGTFNHIGTPCSKFESPCKHQSMFQYRPNH
jgi:excisionase family DNA binding protein